MDRRSSLINLKEIFQFRYFYSGQERVIKAIDMGNDIVCCAPPNAGLRTAILACSLKTTKQCIFIIRSIAEIESLSNLITDNCKGLAVLISSKIELEERHSKIVDFINQDYQFLLTTPDQFALIALHSPKLNPNSTDMLVIVYNAERIFPESYRYHVSYSTAFNLINDLKSALDITSTTKPLGRFTTLYVSDCLSVESFRQLDHPNRPPATHIHFQREIKVPFKTVRTPKDDEFGYLPTFINDSHPESVIIIAKQNKFQAVKSVLNNLNIVEHYHVIIQFHSAKAQLADAPAILITDSLSTLEHHKFGLCIIHDVPDNTSQITFILNAAKEHGTHLLFGHPFCDDIPEERIATLAPPPALLENTLNFLNGCAVGTTVTWQDVARASSKGLSSTALRNFLSFLISQSYLKLKKGSAGKGYAKNSKSELFEIQLLPSYELLLDMANRNHKRAIKRHNEVIALLTSSKCKQETFNELNGASTDPLMCGICDICKPKPVDTRLPTLDEILDELRNELFTLREIAAESKQLPAAVLLPNSTIEQILEFRPTSLAEICKLDGFRGNERHLLFGEDILRLLKAKLSYF